MTLLGHRTFGRSVSFTIRVEADQVGQEGVEVFEIPLHITSEGLSEPVFVMGSAFVTVTDMSGELYICLVNVAYCSDYAYVLGMPSGQTCH